MTKKTAWLLLLLSGCDLPPVREGVVARKAVGPYDSHYVIDSTGARCQVNHPTWAETDIGSSVICEWVEAP